MSLASQKLEALRGIQGIWRGNQSAVIPAIGSGHPALDLRLPGQGWPRGSLVELMPATPGIGEISLLIPALRRIAADKRIAFIHPPFIPFAPALSNSGLPLQRTVWIDAQQQNGQWAAEQSLRSGAVGAVLCWNASTDATDLRRLQLAAEAGGAIVFLFRAASAIAQPSTAALRLVLVPQNGRLRVDLVKARGGKPGTVVVDPYRNNAAAATSQDTGSERASRPSYPLPLLAQPA